MTWTPAPGEKCYVEAEAEGDGCYVSGDRKAKDCIAFEAAHAIPHDIVDVLEALVLNTCDTDRDGRLRSELAAHDWLHGYPWMQAALECLVRCGRLEPWSRATR